MTNLSSTFFFFLLDSFAVSPYLFSAFAFFFISALQAYIRSSATLNTSSTSSLVCADDLRLLSRESQHP